MRNPEYNFTMAPNIFAAKVEEEILSPATSLVDKKVCNIMILVTDDLKLVTANPHVCYCSSFYHCLL
jgi:hypothetical protein